MKVLWFSNTPALGQEYLSQHLKGSGGWMAALNEVIQDKVDLSIVFTYPYPVLPFAYGKTMFYPVYTGNIVVENLKQRWLIKVYDVDFLPQYLEIIDLVKPDIIHIHGTENSFSCILDKVDTPVVISIQGVLTVINHKFRSGMFGDFIKVKQYSYKLKNLLFDNTGFYHNYKKLEAMALIEQRNLKSAKYIIGRTEWDRRVSRLLAPKSKYYIVNEALRGLFYTNTWHKDNISGKLIIHTTNGNSYFKGFETICSTLTILNEYGINVEWRVAGISENSLINTVVKKFLKKNYPQKGLVLMGSLKEQELVEKLKEAHIYVTTSHIENSPNSLCEAMILGMPCIATNAGGTSSLLTDQQEGILIQDGDPWGLAGTILEMREDWDKALLFGKQARVRALFRHDRESIVKSLLETYQSILKNNQ